MKVCFVCKLSKAESEFAKDKSRKDGLQPKCTPCRKDHYSNNKDKVLAQSKERYKKNAAHVKAQCIEYRKNNHLRVWASSTINSHKLQGYIVSVTIEEVLSLVDSKPPCVYCGIPLKWNRGKYAGNSPTLDRIDNSREVARHNIQVVCRSCNLTKQHRTHNEFVSYCQAVAEKFIQDLKGGVK